MRFWLIFLLRIRTNQTEPSMSIDLQQALQRTIEHREIFHDEMLALMRKIMSGEASPVMVAALTVGLRVKKETIGEIAAAAQVMREFSTKVEVADHEHLVDIVGTGGDASHTFNISTASMFVAAAAATNIDAVEMLNVCEASPPVPTMSTRCSWSATSTLVENSRITCAAAAISPIVSFFTRRPTVSAATITGDASPLMILRISASISS